MVVKSIGEIDGENVRHSSMDVTSVTASHNFTSNCSAPLIISAVPSRLFTFTAVRHHDNHVFTITANYHDH
jgi:hypothetical protein